ncbi:hypothetical protein Tco_1499762 [Tanacetum coccineum]
MEERTFAWKFKKRVSPSKKKAHVAVEEPAEKHAARRKSAGDQIRETLGVSVSNKKSPAKVERSKWIELLFEAASLEEAQLKKDIKISKQEIDIHQAGDSSEGANFESEGDSDDNNDDDNDDDDKVFNHNKTDDEEEDEFVHTPDDYVTVTAGPATQKTEVPLQSSSISSDYATKFLNFDNIPSSNTEIISMMDVKVQHEDPSIQTLPLLTVPVIVIPETLTASATTTPPPILPFISLQQQSTSIPTPTTTKVTTSTTVVPDSETLLAIHLRVSDLEKEVKELKNVDHSLALCAIIKYEVSTAIKEYLGTSLDDALYKHKALYHALIKSILEDEDAIDKGVTDKLKKKRPDDAERYEGPPAGPDQGSYVKLEYNMEECYKALIDQLDWNNPEGDRYPFNLSKPLPLVQLSNRQIVPVDYFFNSDLAYLQGEITNRTYTTSLTMTKAAKYNLPRIENMVPNLWSPIKVAYDKHALLEQTLQPQRRRHVAPSRCITYVHKMYCNLKESGRSSTWYRELPKEAQHIQVKNTDSTLQSVWDTLHDMATNLRMGYNETMPKRRLSHLDKTRSHIMVKEIHHQLWERRLMRSLEKFVGGFQKLLEWNNALLEVILKVELVDLMAMRMRDEGNRWECDKFMLASVCSVIVWQGSLIMHLRCVRQMGEKQERLHKGFNEMETINESGYLPDMLLNKAYNIREMLQEKLEQLSEVERVFVHIDFEFSHRPEHKAKV